MAALTAAYEVKRNTQRIKNNQAKVTQTRNWGSNRTAKLQSILTLYDTVNAGRHLWAGCVLFWDVCLSQPLHERPWSIQHNVPLETKQTNTLVSWWSYQVYKNIQKALPGKMISQSSKVSQFWWLKIKHLSKIHFTKHYGSTLSRDLTDYDTLNFQTIFIYGNQCRHCFQLLSWRFRQLALIITMSPTL